MVCDDPDAPLLTFVHWVVYDIPASATGFPEAVPPQPTLPDGSRQGINSWKKVGYGGPSPPGHKPHRYFFRLSALREPVRATSALSAKDLARAIRDRVLESAECFGTYARI